MFKPAYMLSCFSASVLRGEWAYNPKIVLLKLFELQGTIDTGLS